MANKYRGEVSVRLDKVRTLKFNFNAITKFQQATGRPIEHFMQEILLTAKDMMAGQVRPPTVGAVEECALLWCALIHEDPLLTMEQAGEMFEHAEGDGMNVKRRWVATKLVAAYWLWSGSEPQKKTALKLLEKLDKGELDLREKDPEQEPQGDQAMGSTGGSSSLVPDSPSGPENGTGEPSRRSPTGTSASVLTSSGI